MLHFILIFIFSIFLISYHLSFCSLLKNYYYFNLFLHTFFINYFPGENDPNPLKTTHIRLISIKYDPHISQM